METTAEKEANKLRESGSPWLTEFLVTKVGEIPLGHEEPCQVVAPAAT